MWFWQNYAGGFAAMRKERYELARLLDIPKWEVIQDQLAEITGTAIITINYRGTPITKHSLRTEFCSVIRSNPVSCKRCYKCDALAGLEAVRLDRPFIYLCHCGIVDVAVPVVVDGMYLGAVMFGEVRLPEGDSEDKVRRLVNEISSFQPESGQTQWELMELYDRIPEMEYAQIEKAGKTIESIIQYIIGQAVNIQTKEQTFDWMIKNVTSQDGEKTQKFNSYIEEVRAPSVKPVASVSNLPVSIERNSPVYPAVVYIEEHIDQKITLDEMAALCNVSNSYFSRVFSRDVKEGFRDYADRRKVSAAKEMLHESNASVSEVSDQLGFSDISYFIKIFKRMEGITPKAYLRRKYR